MRKALIVISLLSATMFSSGAPASAVQPIVTRLYESGSDVPVEDCGTFLVLLDFDHRETITTYLDGSGEPVKTQIRFSFQATLTNSVTGKAVYETGNYSITMDFRSGSSRVAGLVLQIRMAGAGVVVLELAQVTFDAAGNPSLTSGPRILQGDSLVCSFLS